jgi:hypothetical protein
LILDSGGRWISTTSRSPRLRSWTKARTPSRLRTHSRRESGQSCRVLHQDPLHFLNRFRMAVEYDTR